MNITQQRYSLLRLWLESFSVINRCTGQILWLIVISVILFAMVAGVMVLAMGTSGALATLQMGKAAQAVSIGAALAYMVLSLGMNLYGLLFWTVCCRLVANQAKQERQPLAETFSGALLPTVYQIATGILLAIPFMILGILAALLRSPVVMALLLGVLFFTVGIRLCYSFIAIAVDGKGPIEGLTHSWKMTAGKNYIDTLLMCLVMFGSVLLMYAVFAAIGYGLFVLIPLHFAGSFSLAHPSLLWILVALVLGVLAMFCYFVILAFPVLVFINRNAVLFDARNTLDQAPVFVPLPQLELPDLNPNPEHMQQAESTIRTPVLSERAVQPAAPQPANPPKQPAPAEKPQNIPTLDGLEISQSSINTSEEDTKTLSEHLDKVYTPKPEDVVQYGDEDRMPTILFDDEMAKQLQENQAQYAPKPANDSANKKDNGPDTIKMSKF